MIEDERLRIRHGPSPHVTFPKGLKRSLPSGKPLNSSTAPESSKTGGDATSMEDIVSSSVTINIRGISVLFPYQPYPCQIKYMERCLGALLEPANALLESPTGTGKTLCLLSAVFAWQNAIIMGTIPNPCNKKIGTIRKNDEQTTQTLPRHLTKAQKMESVELQNRSAKTAWEKIGEENFEDIMSDQSTTKAVVIEKESQVKKNKEPLKKEPSSKIAVPQIFYASRTHAQLAQIITEIKKSPYYKLSQCRIRQGGQALSKSEQNAGEEKDSNKENKQVDQLVIRATVIASRDHYCIHPTPKRDPALKGAILSAFCKKQTRNKQNPCVYHCGMNRELRPKSIFASDALDIEDLKVVAQRGFRGGKPFCPFYLAREYQNVCNIVLLPYNYLLEKPIRDSLKIDLRDTVVIVDEAHNLEGVAENAASIDMKTQDFRAVIAAIKEAAREDGQLDLIRQSTTTTETCPSMRELERILIKPLNRLLNFISEVPLRASTSIKEPHCLLTAKELFDKLETLGFNESNFSVTLETIGKVHKKLEEMAFECNYDKTEEVNQLLALASKVDLYMGMLTTILGEDYRKYSKSYVCVIRNNVGSTQTRTDENKRGRISAFLDPIHSQEGDGDRIFSYWCFSAAVAVHQIVGNLSNGCRSLIITSGTLKPTQCLGSALGAEFDYSLENTHAIHHSQLYTCTVPYRDSSRPLLLNYENCGTNSEHLVDVGLIISDVCNATRLENDGVIAFFPSYAVMQKCVNLWKNRGIYDSLAQCKELFIEPNTQEQFEIILEDFKSAVQKTTGEKPKKRRSMGSSKYRNHNTHGAIMLAVCRGRVSEGLSLSDSMCRIVIVVGIPYPSLMDSRVNLKKLHLDANPLTANSQRFSGRDWYVQEAYRAVNQSIGRVIRHKNDYGAAILIDARYGEKGVRLSLPNYAQDSLQYWKEEGKIGETWSDKLDGLKSFLSKFGGGDTCNNLKVVKNVATAKITPQSRKQKSVETFKFKKLRPMIRPSVCESDSNTSHTQTTLSVTMIRPSAQTADTSENDPTQIEPTQVDQEETPIIMTSCALCTEQVEAAKCRKNPDCLHTACRQCWAKTLSCKLECPFCRRRVRPNYLEDGI